MYFHQTELSQMTAAWLLPIVAPIVAAASGGIVAEVLPNPQHALWTVMVSYILWGTGVPLAMAVLVIYFQRLTVHKLPPREGIVSVFLPLGPLGQGGFAIMQLGKVALKVFPETETLSGTAARPGDILYVVGWLIALIMWGFAIVWLFFALASISRSKFPFNMGTHPFDLYYFSMRRTGQDMFSMGHNQWTDNLYFFSGWWGFTFPLGVLAVSTTNIGKETSSRFFDVLGTVSISLRRKFPQRT